MRCSGRVFLYSAQGRSDIGLAVVCGLLCAVLCVAFVRSLEASHNSDAARSGPRCVFLVNSLPVAVFFFPVTIFCSVLGLSPPRGRWGRWGLWGPGTGLEHCVNNLYVRRKAKAVVGSEAARLVGFCFVLDGLRCDFDQQLGDAVGSYIFGQAQHLRGKMVA